MKTICAVILAFITFIIGWFAISGIAFLIEWLASASSGGLDFIHGLHRLLMFVLEPGLGAFFAVYVPSILFRSVKPKTIFVSSASIIIIIFILNVFSIATGTGTTPVRMRALLQSAAMVGGAYIGFKVAKISLQKG